MEVFRLALFRRQEFIRLLQICLETFLFRSRQQAWRTQQSPTRRRLRLRATFRLRWLRPWQMWNWEPRKSCRRHLQAAAMPAFVAGEEVYVFLWNTQGNENYLLGWTQGTFRVARDPQTGLEKVTQDSAAAPLFDVATKKFRHGGVRNLPLPIFQLKLKRALEKQNR